MTIEHTDALVLGAVAYAPKVVTIWEGFKQWLAQRDFAFDFVLYSNYERQVEGHFHGHFDLAWNSPLAWLEAVRLAERLGRERPRAIAMRDTDCDLTSLVVVRDDSDITEIDDLRGRTVAVGADDSPQATLIPLLHLAEAGLEPGRDIEVQRHDRLVGKHGDHIGGERLAARALLAGDADAACMIDGNHLAFRKDGTLPAGATRVLAQTGTFDHCNFTVLEGAPMDRIERFRELLLGMSWDDPEVRPLLEMEGLKAWKPGRTDGYALLDRAIDRFSTIDPWLDAMPLH